MTSRDFSDSVLVDEVNVKCHKDVKVLSRYEKEKNERY